MTEIQKLISSLNYEGLRSLLSKNPSLANEGIPFDEKKPTKAHPLHRICDGVFCKFYTDEQGVEIAKIFLDNGAMIDGLELIEKKDTPLIAAASLNADKVGLLYIDRSANIHHRGTHGGTAVHWAAWTGRDVLVDRLIKAGADIHKKCIDFDSTPVQWAVHGYNSSKDNRHHQYECAQLLIAAGAEKITFPPE